MDDQWDNDLKKRISEVFENYEDTSADEGWQLLREKYPPKAKRRGAVWLWLGSAAAVLLLCLGILWFKVKDNHQQKNLSAKITGKGTTAPQVVKNNSEKTHVDSNGTSAASQSPAIKSNQNNLALTNSKNKSVSPSIAINNTQSIAVNHLKRDNRAITKQPGANQTVGTRANNPVGGKPDAVIALVPKNNQQKQDNLQNPSSVKQDAIVNVIPKNNGNVQSPIKTQAVSGIDTGAAKSMAVVTPPGVDMRKKQDAKKINQLFENDRLANNQKITKAPNNDKAVRLGVYAATYFNYAKGSSNQFNVGAGVTSDIRITKNLNVSTGLSVAQNTLSYTGQPPVQAVATLNAVASANTALSTASFFSPAKAIYSASSPAFKNYNVNMVGIDIPLNVKFVFDPQKSQSYILAGVSSGTFINETYTYSYDNPSLYSANVSQVQDQSTSNSFNGFYFAKTLNLAFGTGYLIGRNRLVVEPFLKYPLDGLGSQQIRFGAGGVNLKFNFQAKKK